MKNLCYKILFLNITLILVVATTENIESAEVADNSEQICRTRDNQCGMCTKVVQCNSLYQSHKRGRNHDITFLEKSKANCLPKDERMYCCAFKELKKIPINFSHPHHSAAPSINENMTSNNVKIGEHPWMVLIDGKDDYNTYENLCSGALINNLFVLTTASGFVNTFIKNNLKLTIKFGLLNTEKISNEQKILVDTKHFYNDNIYTDNMFKNNLINDIALLKLERKVKFTSNIIPISLFLKHTGDNNVTLLKWKRNNSNATVLEKYKTPNLKLETCKHENDIDTTKQLCLNDFTNRENYLGGQIVKNVLFDGKEIYKLIGLNSFYKDDKHSIIIYLESYKDWILNITCI